MKNHRALIKSGRLIDPALGIDEITDVLIENGEVSKISKGASADRCEIIDATDLVVAPGFIDMHTHLREPGREDEETIETAGKAALAGGFTTMVAMPNTDPVADSATVIHFIKNKAAKTALAKVECAGAISKGLRGDSLAAMGEMAEAGAVAFTDDGFCVQNSELMRRAMEYSVMLQKPLLLHCEENTLACGGQMNEGYWSTLLGLKGIPAAAEEIMVSRDIALAEITGATLHFTHISTAKSHKLISDARDRGLAVTCDATPHHLTLCEELVQGYDANFKVNPPLRSKDDVSALLEALKIGSIDAIATDHAPHAKHEKEEWESSACGMIGLETAFGVLFTELIEKNILTLPGLIAKFTSVPASILKLSRGSLHPGMPADIVIFDPSKDWEVKPENFSSKSANSPFIGWKLKAPVVHLMVDGRILIKDGGLTLGV